VYLKAAVFKQLGRLAITHMQNSLAVVPASVFYFFKQLFLNNWGYIKTKKSI
jgi:hypothetical protein